MKIKTLLLLLLAIVMFSWGCSPEDPALGDNKEDMLEIVDNVPSELFHWLSHELALNRGARVFSNSHEGYTYYVASTGNQSVVNGEIDIAEKDLESEQWRVKLEYNYSGVTERSPERHFLIIKVPEDRPVRVSLAAVTGAEQ